MFLVRPIAHDDLDSLEQFAFATALGMNSLPRNRNALKNNIDRSIESFRNKLSPIMEDIYLFALENTETKKMIGCCGIYAKTGMTDPLYFFRVETVQPHSSFLPLPSDLRILHPVIRHNGPAELCALYLMPEWRKGGLGELLSLSRMLLIASHPDRFSPEIMARLRGYINRRNNTSVFWEGVGKHFLHVSFVETQHLLENGRSFISEFFPKYPIYVSFIPPQAQAVIGKPHITTRPAMTMLLHEDFSSTAEIDIFDGGPTLIAKTIGMRTVKKSCTAKVTEIISTVDSPKQHLICNNSLDFRATLGRLKINPDKGIVLSTEAAKVLQVEKGMIVRFAETHHG